MATAKIRRAGRPVDTEKTASIVEAAKDLFFAHGVEAVTVEQIASAAGVAKTTVYSKFGSKDVIFQHVLSEIAEVAEQDMQVEDDTSHDPQKVLAAYGYSLMRNLTQSKIIAAEPIIILETRRNPGLGQKFFDMGPGRAKAHLTKTIACWQEDGILAAEDDAADMAEDLLGLWMGIMPHRIKMCGPANLTDDEIRSRANRGARNFFKLHGIGAA